MLDSLRSRFNVWSLVFAGVMGGLLGSILGAMQIQKMFRGESVNYEAATNTMIGSFSGIFHWCYFYCHLPMCRDLFKQEWAFPESFGRGERGITPEGAKYS